MLSIVEASFVNVIMTDAVIDLNNETHSARLSSIKLIEQNIAEQIQQSDGIHFLNTISYLFPSSSASLRSLTDLLGLGAGTGGRTTGGHIPGFSAALLAAVSLIAVI